MFNPYGDLWKNELCVSILEIFGTSFEFLIFRLVPVAQGIRKQ